MYYRHSLPAHAGLFRDVVDRLNPRRQLRTDAHPLVEMTLMRQGGRTLLHLINLSGHSQTGYFPPVPMRDIHIEVAGEFQDRGRRFARRASWPSKHSKGTASSRSRNCRITSLSFSNKAHEGGNSVKSILRCIALLLPVLSTASAQVSTGTITGYVHDSSDAVIVGAKVTITQTGNLRAPRDASPTSAASSPRLICAAGNTPVTVVATGFKGQTLTGIVLAVDQTVKLPVVMQPGVVEQSIEVYRQRRLWWTPPRLLWAR